MPPGLEVLPAPSHATPPAQRNPHSVTPPLCALLPLAPDLCLPVCLPACLQWTAPAALFSKTQTTRWSCPQWPLTWHLVWGGGQALHAVALACLSALLALDGLPGCAARRKASWHLRSGSAGGRKNRQSSAILLCVPGKCAAGTVWHRQRYMLRCSTRYSRLGCVSLRSGPPPASAAGRSSAWRLRGRWQSAHG
jgi:hypothetical protein